MPSARNILRSACTFQYSHLPLLNWLLPTLNRRGPLRTRWRREKDPCQVKNLFSGKEERHGGMMSAVSAPPLLQVEEVPRQEGCRHPMAHLASLGSPSAGRACTAPAGMSRTTALNNTMNAP